LSEYLQLLVDVYWLFEGLMVQAPNAVFPRAFRPKFGISEYYVAKPLQSRLVRKIAARSPIASLDVLRQTVFSRLINYTLTIFNVNPVPKTLIENRMSKSTNRW
jgi:hypothetical protein